MDEILGAFVEDAREHLAAMEAGLLSMDEGDRDPEVLNAVFRAAHTIKGDAGIVELPALERFAHALENTLDELRRGVLEPERGLVTLLLSACDRIRAMLEGVAGGWDGASVPVEAMAVLDALRAHTHAVAAPDATLAAMPLACVPAGDVRLTDCWHIAVCFGVDIFRNGMDPLDFFRYLRGKGEIVRFVTQTDGLPEAVADMDPESCYLGFDLFLHSEESKESIEQVFEFVRDDCDLRVLPPEARVGDYIDLIEDLPDEAMRLGEILVKSDALTVADVDDGLRAQQREEAGHPLGELLVDQQMVQPEIVAAAAQKQKQISDKRSAEARQIRVAADKLDQLIDLVGELVISSAAANLLARESRQTRLMEANSGLARLVESIREFSLQLRMVKIGETFGRFRRVVRDLANEMGRTVDLSIRGDDTELDKSVVEKIGDPLMHLIRNALDHGIERPEVRRERGKPANGRIELNAYHEAGGIVIEVADDGGGLDRERILAKAVERGLVQADAALVDQDIFDLIFEPGFSTSDAVTNISGRGVGMDVVRSNIRALRGTVEVHSEAGAGTRFVMRLPLTMSIIDGFLVGAGDAAYVIPLEMVVECIELPPTAGGYLNLRGEVLPFIRLHELFAPGGERSARENVVVVKAGNRKAGIVVDALQGEFQTVVKPLSPIFRHLRGIAGSTILGSGDVALILDVKALIELAAQAGARPGSPAA